MEREKNLDCSVLYCTFFIHVERSQMAVELVLIIESFTYVIFFCLRLFFLSKSIKFHLNMTGSCLIVLTLLLSIMTCNQNFLAASGENKAEHSRMFEISMHIMRRK